MATSIMPSPGITTMVNERIPLSSKPSNSPIRSNKRTRIQAELGTKDFTEPPIKRQAIGEDENKPPRISVKQSPAMREAEMRLFNRTPLNAPTTPFERKLVAARDNKSTITSHTTVQKRTTGYNDEESLDNIRAWQRHYKKAFPSFVFYYESVTDETRMKISRMVLSLGAKEEKFFSRLVTHVVTSRSIPTLMNNEQSRQKTIDPILLQRTQFNNDILIKAQQFGMKIWTLDKIQRMMHVMFHTETGENTNLIRSHGTTNLIEKDNLSKLLQKEKIIGPSSDISHIPLKGFYIYIHDMDERTRPVMVRDYPKVAHKEEGKWPQLRLSSIGRCPFIEDPNYSKQVAERAALKEKHKNIQSPKKLLPPPVVQKRDVRYIGGEPVASGIQGNNITSAIRSQILSSTTATNTTKPNSTSKELYALKRKVLERGTNMNDVRAALNDESKKEKKKVVKDVKPGYCENCKDKFENFDEHILSRKHRKFALTLDNWTQLDDLLHQLVRK